MEAGDDSQPGLVDPGLNTSPSVAVLIPTYNAGIVWREACAALARQTPRPDFIRIWDSGSTDTTREIAEEFGFSVTTISPLEFGHGRTRNRMAESVPDAEIIIFLTQDAVLTKDDSLSRLVETFSDPRIGAAYGRQLPRPQAGPLERQARLFNYPDKAKLVTPEDADRLGIKAVFVSNSFCAWRREALLAQGGFPDVIMGEDVLGAAKLLQAGWTLAYVPAAQVWHSHAYSIPEEARRYFDIGVFHAASADLLARFSRPEKEGLRLVRHQMAYLWTNAPGQIGPALIRLAAKYAGYRLGTNYRHLPQWLVQRFSMHARWWTTSPRNNQP